MAPFFPSIRMTLLVALPAASSAVFLTAPLVPLLAMTVLAAGVAALFAATPRPGDYLDLPDGHHRVIAPDHELTGPGLRLSGPVANRDVQA